MYKYIWCVYIYKYVQIYIYTICIYIYMPPYEILPLPPLWLVVAHPPTPLPNPWGGWGERRRTEDGTIYIYMYCIHI